MESKDVQSSGTRRLAKQVREVMRDEYQLSKKQRIAPWVVSTSIVVVTLIGSIAFRSGAVEKSTTDMSASLVRLEKLIQDQNRDIREIHNKSAKIEGFYTALEQRVALINSRIEDHEKHSREIQKEVRETLAQQRSLIERNVSNIRTVRGRFDAHEFRTNHDEKESQHEPL